MQSQGPRRRGAGHCPAEHTSEAHAQASVPDVGDTNSPDGAGTGSGNNMASISGLSVPRVGLAAACGTVT